MKNNMDVAITCKVVIWFYLDKYGTFNIDDTSEIRGVAEQLMAESLGLA